MRSQALPEPLRELGVQPTGDPAGTASRLGTKRTEGPTSPPSGGVWNCSSASGQRWPWGTHCCVMFNSGSTENGTQGRSLEMSLISALNGAGGHTCSF